MSGVCLTVKDGEGELLVSLIKLVSGMVRRKSGGRQVEKRT
jgi:hypothetical protein